MSLRRRLTLSLFTILVLFATNVGTHFWGSYARSESMVAYGQAEVCCQVRRGANRDDGTAVFQKLSELRHRDVGGHPPNSVTVFVRYCLRIDGTTEVPTAGTPRAGTRNGSPQRQTWAGVPGCWQQGHAGAYCGCHCCCCC